MTRGGGRLQQFADDLENADIATPLDANKNLRGRVALRRMRQPGLDTPRTPRAEGDATPVRIVDPSDVAVTYRMPAHMTPARPGADDGAKPVGQILRL